MHIHELKAWPETFEQILHGLTTADIRSDDRAPRFEAGNQVWYREFDPRLSIYTGHEAFYVIANVLRPGRGSPFSKALKNGYCVLILAPVAAGQIHRFNADAAGTKDRKRKRRKDRAHK